MSLNKDTLDINKDNFKMIYQQGYDAGYSGKSETTNPYLNGTIYYLEWLSGFNDGLYETEIMSYE